MTRFVLKSLLQVVALAGLCVLIGPVSVADAASFSLGAGQRPDVAVGDTGTAHVVYNGDESSAVSLHYAGFRVGWGVVIAVRARRCLLLLRVSFRVVKR